MASQDKILSVDIIKLIFLILFFCQSVLTLIAQPKDEFQTWIRINQLGYLPEINKAAVLCSKTEINCDAFMIVDAGKDSVVFRSNKIEKFGAYGPFAETYRLDFTGYKFEGSYYIEAAGVKSPIFRIASDVYDGTADFLLKYMRQQRCGFNPFLNDSCHTHDGFTVYGPMPDSTHIDVTGGWHDAADYLQYLATSANATFNMFLAARDYPDQLTLELGRRSPVKIQQHLTVRTDCLAADPQID